MNSVDTATICEHLWGPVWQSFPIYLIFQFAWNPKETRFQKITSASSMSSALGISIVMTILHTIYENWDDATKLTKVANMVMAAACMFCPFNPIRSSVPDITDSTYPAKFLAQVDQMYKEGTFPYSPGEALLRKVSLVFLILSYYPVFSTCTNSSGDNLLAITPSKDAN